MVTKLDNIAKDVVQLLKDRSMTLATAESCTGGLISAALTSVPGSSAVFGYGVCSYANEAKEKLLGVKSGTLDAHGAVSDETAREMAEGVCSLSGADIGVSVTGIAGPDGGTDEKPVGTVYIGTFHDNKAVSERYVFTGDMFPQADGKREAIRLETAYTALSSVKEILLRIR